MKAYLQQFRVNQHERFLASDNMAFNSVNVTQNTRAHILRLLLLLFVLVVVVIVADVDAAADDFLGIAMVIIAVAISVCTTFCRTFYSTALRVETNKRPKMGMSVTKRYPVLVILFFLF